MKSKMKMFGAIAIGILLAVAVVVVHQDLRDEAKAEHVENIVSKITGALAPNAILRDRHVSNAVNSRVNQLPADGGQWYLTVITADSASQASPDTFGRELLARFDSDPRLARLKSQSHFWHGWPGMPQFDQRVGPWFGFVAPAVMLQRGDDGLIIYKATGNVVPNTADELVAQMQASVEAYQLDVVEWQSQGRKTPCAFVRLAQRLESTQPGCPWCPKPQPTPQPQPTPAPQPQPIPDFGVPREPAMESSDDLSTGACLAIAGGIGVLLFVGLKFRKDLSTIFGS